MMYIYIYKIYRCLCVCVECLPVWICICIYNLLITNHNGGIADVCIYMYIYIHIYAHGYMYINVYIYTLYICKHTAMIGPGAMTISWCRYEEKPRVSNRKKSKRPGLGNIALKVANWSMDILKASFVRLNIWYIK